MAQLSQGVGPGTVWGLFFSKVSDSKYFRCYQLLWVSLQYFAPILIGSPQVGDEIEPAPIICLGMYASQDTRVIKNSQCSRVQSIGGTLCPSIYLHDHIILASNSIRLIKLGKNLLIAK